MHLYEDGKMGTVNLMHRGHSLLPSKKTATTKLGTGARHKLMSRSTRESSVLNLEHMHWSTLMEQLCKVIKLLIKSLNLFSVA